eukprot:CAMPEP_0203856280 /NCGR_PEP_ID=MMETSP0359-20131031/10082_1 /ASSEMBLY_ACC=CAM_ASM_000338 /TAXON_ID=268821 /ORGANISM="Scrippsiella Hangoei, Strain SHTV-5" /LENGTH=103 /DNA_ID=CAMNT_0050772873 /DNA_START=422 /DNA_END=732 /DNA_ORIENTATION=+
MCRAALAAALLDPSPRLAAGLCEVNDPRREHAAHFGCDGSPLVSPDLPFVHQVALCSDQAYDDIVAAVVQNDCEHVPATHEALPVGTVVANEHHVRTTDMGIS